MRHEPDIKDPRSLKPSHDERGQKRDVKEYIKPAIYTNLENERDTKGIQRAIYFLAEKV